MRVLLTLAILLLIGVAESAEYGVRGQLVTDLGDSSLSQVQLGWVDLPKFDPAMGDLESVQVEIAAMLEANLAVSHESSNAIEVGEVLMAVNYAARGTGGELLAPSGDGNLVVREAYQVAAGQVAELPVAIDRTTTTHVLEPSIDFLEDGFLDPVRYYFETGYWDIYAIDETGFGPHFGVYALLREETLTFDVTVTYLFSVPEPSSFCVVLALGVTMFAGSSRRAVG